ncbi:PD-(D/E)XK motif protein [Muribaculaceae bacterium Isolate-039 (Harlan)]|nr:PD-(D/E)XK motif protein [Muribaculaceae bacterium Isolate-039 (Harlan)]ROS94304.1 PD-(D/E)XK motif protein [Muribaculaceae bacterium Isolate-077 (Janvier)]ROS97312.1 PD-(D/E)XK motif protein [Muribaculaceae bacterium Isolate-083 (Janvier)]ROS97436.1 PD-(D/E)XK motif protein [Muribaculaceae bacterium Isolate-084 (Janvier)]RXE70667.1 PD-(D/E)XK motif protein [Muribaculaceae bacterium Isolate-002 (NCI)]
MSHLKNKMTMRIKDIDIYRLFSELVQNPSSDNQYRVASISPLIPHKIGCSEENYPMFFVETSDKKMQNDIKMEYFKVLFNRKCQWATSDGGNEIKKYTIIQLNSHMPELQRYFLEVVLLVLFKLAPIPQNSAVREEILNIINLFASSKEVSKDIIVGLWAELFVIDQSKDPNYLLASWHVTPEDKYDFNDGESKIEVKATTGEKHAHAFSIDQLNPNPHSDLIIASILIQQSGIGESIMNLMDRIYPRVSDLDLQYKLQSIVLQTIGTSWNEVSRMFFDYDYARCTYKLFASTDIPAIDKNNVPPQVSSVKFVSDLSGVEPICESSLTNLLHKSL